MVLKFHITDLVLIASEAENLSRTISDPCNLFKNDCVTTIEVCDQAKQFLEGNLQYLILQKEECEKDIDKLEIDERNLSEKISNLDKNSGYSEEYTQKLYSAHNELLEACGKLYLQREYLESQIQKTNDNTAKIRHFAIQLEQISSLSEKLIERGNSVAENYDILSRSLRNYSNEAGASK